MLKKWSYILIWVLAVASVVFLLGFTGHKNNHSKCVALKVIIKNSEDHFFVDEDDIRKMFYERGDTLVGELIQNINIHEIEKIVKTNPWINDANAYLSVGGMLTIEAEQKMPLLRIINNHGESYYMDTLGNLILWSPKYTPRVVVVSGNINERFNIWSSIKMSDIENSDTLRLYSHLDDIYKVVKHVNTNKFLSAQIDQVYLNFDMEFELIPRAGKQRILFGDIQNMEEKFHNLCVFYTNGLKYSDWNKYDTINLKYKNQIVCSKIN